MSTRKPPAKKAAAAGKKPAAKKAAAAPRKRAPKKAAAPAEPAVSDNDRQVLELRRAGVSVAAIAVQMEKPVADVLDGYRRALDETAPSTAEDLRVLAIDRLDRLIQPYWTKALRGDADAAAAVARLLEAQLRAGAKQLLPSAGAGPVQKATAVEVALLKLSEHTLAATALVLARSVDQNADRPLAASTVARELRQTMSTLRAIAGDLAPSEPAGSDDGVVVPPSQLEAARAKARKLAGDG